MRCRAAPSLHRRPVATAGARGRRASPAGRGRHRPARGDCRAAAGLRAGAAWNRRSARPGTNTTRNDRPRAWWGCRRTRVRNAGSVARRRADSTVEPGPRLAQSDRPHLAERRSASTVEHARRPPEHLRHEAQEARAIPPSDRSGQLANVSMSSRAKSCSAWMIVAPRSIAGIRAGLGLLGDERLELARVFRIEPVEPAMPPIAVVNQLRIDQQPLPSPRRSQRARRNRRGRVLFGPLRLTRGPCSPSSPARPYVQVPPRWCRPPPSRLRSAPARATDTRRTAERRSPRWRRPAARAGPGRPDRAAVSLDRTRRARRHARRRVRAGPRTAAATGRGRPSRRSARRLRHAAGFGGRSRGTRGLSPGAENSCTDSSSSSSGGASSREQHACQPSERARRPRIARRRPHCVECLQRIHRRAIVCRDGEQRCPRARAARR